MGRTAFNTGSRGADAFSCPCCHPPIHRLEEAGWLTSTWQRSENNRRAKYYTVTRAGRRQLGEEAAQWNRIALAIARALDA